MEIAIIAGVLSFALGVWIYPKYIKRLQKANVAQTPSEYALDEYKDKAKTVTFGGVIFVFIPVIVAIILGGFSMPLYLIIFTFVSYALIGLIDDYKIVKEGKNDGLTPKQKLFSQFLIAIIFYVLYLWLGGSNVVFVPILNIELNLSYFYFIFILLYLAGFSNAVNLTDGMDGLAGGTSVIALVGLVYLVSQTNSTSISVLICAVIGGLLSFLVFNRKPAQIFMGDVGSLALGGLFASIAVLLHLEIIMLIIGFVFVFETACVVMQQTSWRLLKRKIFKYTPIHYSFTLSGWSEQKVVNFFYLLGIIFMIIGIWIGVAL